MLQLTLDMACVQNLKTPASDIPKTRKTKSTNTGLIWVTQANDSI